MLVDIVEYQPWILTNFYFTQNRGAHKTKSRDWQPPIYKKGNKSEIENYRPIANLCSTSKILEKLILKQIHYLESKNKLDLILKSQHGFKRKKSTATAGALFSSKYGYCELVYVPRDSQNRQKCD